MSPTLARLYETYEKLKEQDLGSSRLHLLMGFQLALRVVEAEESSHEDND